MRSMRVKIKTSAFTVIELIVSTTLVLILFMLIGFVFGSISDSTVKINDKITEGLKVSKFFNELADDFSVSFPVFYLGQNSDGNSVSIGGAGGGNPLTSLPGGYGTSGSLNGISRSTGAAHSEFLRCVTTHHQNGGLLMFNGNEAFDLNMKIDQHDKPVWYTSYCFTGHSNPGYGIHERTVYKRRVPLRPDLRKNDSNLRGGYSIGNFVKVGRPGDEVNAATFGDDDVYQYTVLENVWEIRVSFSEIKKGETDDSLGQNVVMKVTVEFAQVDVVKPHGDPTRYARYSVADTDGNGIPDNLEHTYTTVIVVDRNNLSN